MHRSAGFADPPGRSEGALALPRQRVVAIVTACLWLLIAASAASGLLALITVARLPGAEPGREPALPAGVEGFAQLFVATYLETGEGTENVLRPFYPQSLSLKGIRPRQRYVARTASLEAMPTGADSWSVTVAAEILVEAEEGYRRDGVHYFTVRVARTVDGLTATSLPTEIPGSTIFPASSGDQP
ncbi:MAG: hypothetical protein ACRDJF_03420 [Actinomycetota bacterium]